MFPSIFSPSNGSYLFYGPHPNKSNLDVSHRTNFSNDDCKYFQFRKSGLFPYTKLYTSSWPDHDAFCRSYLFQLAAHNQ